MWSRQIHALLDGYDLSGHIDGSIAIPSSTITTDAGVSTNPAYNLWKRQDRLIYSALLGAITTTLQPILSSTNTAAEIWRTLSDTYAKPSRGHYKQLQQQLKAATKGDKSISEYVQGLTAIFDQLALLGKAEDLEDQIEAILGGLPDDYKTLVDQVEGRDSAPSIPELHEKLINFETKLKSKQAPLLPTPVSAHYTNPRGTGNNNNNTSRHQNYKRGGYRGGGHQTWQQQHFQPTSNTNTPRGYQGKCQICGVFGHSARRCSQLQTQALALSQGGSSNLQHYQPRANVASSFPYNTAPWLLDSGATHHLTSDLNNLSLHQPYHGGDEVAIADGTGLQITHIGSASVPTPSKSLKLKYILCVPAVDKNLISVYRLCNANQVSVEFFPASFQVKDLSTGVQLLQGRTKNELYEWPMSASTKPTAHATYPDTNATLAQWHLCLGHPSPSILHTIVSKLSLPCFSNSVSFSPCNDCLLNIIHKLPFQTSSIKSSQPLQYIFSDVWQSPVLSSENFKYYLLFVDHYTRYTWLYPLTAKSQVKDIFILFKPLVENRFQTKIQTLYTDNGGEYIALRSYLATSGIFHLATPPHTPEHNGLSERKHRHIVETGLSLLSKAQMPLTLWPCAFATVVFLINCMPTKILADQYPYQKLFNQVPNYAKLRTFGCLAYPWLRPYAQNKLENRSLPCVFIGYSLTQSAYYCLDPTTNRIYTTRHVRFNETQFPYHSLTKPKPAPEPIPTDPLNLFQPHTFIPATSPLIHCSPPAANTVPSRSETPPMTQQSHSSTSTSSQSSANDVTPSPPTAPVPSAPVTVAPQAMTAPTSPSPADTVSAPPQPAAALPRHPMTTRSRNNILKPTTKYNNSVQLQCDPHWIPTTWQQAMKHAHWRAAMSSEFNSTNENHTWDLETATATMNIVGCRWVFTIKYHPDGTIDKYKARIVAKGYHQKPGLDYTDTFSPVIKSTTIRIILGLAVNCDWPVRQIDVNTAFLQGHLKEEVFMSQPPGFHDPNKPTHVCRLRKALYGLKQAPRAWYSELKTFLTTIGFRNSLADASLFILKHNGDYVYLLVYVDDILVTGSSSTLVQQIIDAIARKFSIKDMGNLGYFLGIEAIRTSRGLHLMQRKYITDLLTKTNMLNAKPAATPLPSSPKLSIKSGTPLADPHPS